MCPVFRGLRWRWGDGASLISLLSVGAVIEVHGAQIAPIRRECRGAENAHAFSSAVTVLSGCSSMHTRFAPFGLGPVEQVVARSVQSGVAIGSIAGHRRRHADGDVEFGVGIDPHGRCGNGRRMRSATALPKNAAWQAGGTTANSSPPYRPGCPWAATHWASVFANGLQHLVTGRVAVGVIDPLKWSMSSISSRAASPDRVTRSISPPIRPGTAAGWPGQSVAQRQGRTIRQSAAAGTAPAWCLSVGVLHGRAG